MTTVRVRVTFARYCTDTLVVLELPLSLPGSHFSRYIYFLFAPTLLYREDYPRTPTIRWPLVRNMFGQFLIVLIFVYHVVLTFWLPVFKRMFAERERTLESTVSNMFELMMPGCLIVVLGKLSYEPIEQDLELPVSHGSVLRLLSLLAEWLRRTASIR